MRPLVSLPSLLGLSLAAAGLPAAHAVTYTDVVPSGSQVIPDYVFSGVVRTINVGAIPTWGSYEISVSLKIEATEAGTVLGDYYAYLYHADANGSSSVVLLNRLGTSPLYPAGYTDEALDITLRDDAPGGDVHQYRIALGGPSEPALGGPLTGVWQPDGRAESPFTVSYDSVRSQSLNDFSFMSPEGEWSLFISDVSYGGVGRLTEWSLNVVPVPEPSALQLLGVFGTAAGCWMIRRRK